MQHTRRSDPRSLHISLHHSRLTLTRTLTYTRRSLAAILTKTTEVYGITSLEQLATTARICFPTESVDANIDAEYSLPAYNSFLGAKAGRGHLSAVDYCQTYTPLAQRTMNCTNVQQQRYCLEQLQHGDVDAVVV